MSLGTMRKFTGLGLLAALCLSLGSPAAAEPFSAMQMGYPVFSPDGSKLALGLYFNYQPEESYAVTVNEVEVYETSGAGTVKRFWQQNDMVGIPASDLAFSPDSRKLAATWYVYEYVTGARGSTVVWDLVSGKPLPLAGACREPGLGVDFLDDRLFKLGSNYLHWQTNEAFLTLCDLGTGQSQASFPDITRLQAVPELKLLIGFGYIAELEGDYPRPRPIARLYDADSYRQLTALPQLTAIYDLDIAKGTAEAITDAAKPRRVRIDLKHRKLLADLGRYLPKPNPPELAGDENHFTRSLAQGRQLSIRNGYAGYDSALLELRDAKGQLEQGRKLPARVERYALSPDESQAAILSCSQDDICELGLWRLRDLKLMRSWQIETDPARREQPPA